ncbi:MAG: twitching motility protein PilT, partial [Chloroflexi bacterium]|nr:twitching motility protein PilT [Chloroflexota bacterium]
QEGELISVYPVFESFDISLVNLLRPTPLREPKFVLDGHLGRLASYLRMLGFDSSYRNDFNDEELAEISVNEKRILLTRDRGLLKRDKVTHGFLIKTRDPRQQLLSVVRRFDLAKLIHPFTRCIACNGILEPVEKEEVIDLLEPKTRKYFDIFKRCTSCGKVFWAGSHHERMSRLIDWVINETPIS